MERWLLIVIIILISILFYIIVFGYGFNFIERFDVDQRPIIWSYWETKKGTKKPEYIDLCFATFYRHNPTFNIQILDEVSVKTYLPNLRIDLDKLSITHKSDYVRIALLYKYGGIWLDADTIVMRSLMPIIDKLQDYDFVGFGCSYAVCNKQKSGYPKPSNGALASRPNGILMKCVLDRLDKILEKYTTNHDYGYFDLGKKVIWDAIEDLSKTGYTYYHYNSSFDGSRDFEGNWINADDHVAKTKTKFLNEQDLFFVFLENNKFMSKYKWFSQLSKKQIMDGGWWISDLFRQSLSC